MRVKPDCKICGLYEDRGGQIYRDTRCCVLEYKENLLCIFSEHTTKLSKRQREWLHHVLDKFAVSKFKGGFTTQEMAKGDHYHIIARRKNAKKRNTEKSKKKSR